jgi:hypothetical protein
VTGDDVHEVRSVRGWSAAQDHLATLSTTSSVDRAFGELVIGEWGGLDMTHA